MMSETRRESDDCPKLDRFHDSSMGNSEEDIVMDRADGTDLVDDTFYDNLPFWQRLKYCTHGHETFAVVSVYGEHVTLTFDLCFRISLATLVVTTAVILLVAVSSAPRGAGQALVSGGGMDTAPTAPHWVPSDKGPRLVLARQFLLRDVTTNRHAQVMAVDDLGQKYVIELLSQSTDHLVLYLLLDFVLKTETFLAISKEYDEVSRMFQEELVMTCWTHRMDGGKFKGSFAPSGRIVQSPGMEGIYDNEDLFLRNVEVGAPVTLTPLVSRTLNSTCESTRRREVSFFWDVYDEKLICRDKEVEEEDFTCSDHSVCKPFPGVPLSSGMTCRKFRRCNHVKRQCDPFYLHNPGVVSAQPYCACRKSALEDAKRLACPRMADDGGECELPKRDLVKAMATLPCLCAYTFLKIYPYLEPLHTPGGTGTGRGSSGPSSDSADLIFRWRVREDVVNGPALGFDKCPCVS